NRAYQRIFDSGLFKSVEISPKNTELKITVEEFPLIKSINFEGNKKLKEEQLLDIISSKKRFSLNPSKTDNDADLIVEAYRARGLIGASVTPKIVNRPNNLVELIFEIVEGKVTEVERVSFVGNLAYSDRRLRRVLASKQAGLLRRLFRSDTFVAERIRFDKKLLKDFYSDRGFADFKINSTSAELSRDRGSYFMTFNIFEGKRYKFRNISINSEIPELKTKKLKPLLSIKTGKAYSPRIVDNELRKIENKISELNLDFVIVAPVIKKSTDKNYLDINFVVKKGPPIYIQRIDVVGNTVTRDYVVRRQFRTVEGDPFSPSEIRNSAERIRALGIFGNVDVLTRSTDDKSALIVDVKVEEQPTGSFGLGFTYSGDEGGGTSVKMSERNFLGRGQFVAFDYASGTDSNQTSLSFKEPGFLNRDLTFGISVGSKKTNQQFSSYDSEITEFKPSLTFPLTRRSRLQFNYRYSDETLTSKSSALSPAISAQIGTKEINSVGYQYSLDSKKDAIDPNKSVYIRFSQNYSTSDSNFSHLRSTALVKQSRNILRDEVSVSAAFEFGHLSQFEGKSRVTDRFTTFSRQMRGFKAAGIGPRDLHSTNKDPLGGQYFATARFESDFSLGVPEEYGMRAAIFLDAGSVWGLDNRTGTSGSSQPSGLVDDKFYLRSTLGAGLLWSTPIGPLRFDFTKALKKESYDKPESFNFSLSTKF
ncbi:MAG: outer membrane protein assembly factor BamA, partial [Paracoccaceae bacterium]